PATRNRAHLGTTTGTQPSGCRGVSIAPCCSVNAAFLFAEPRMLVVVSRCAPRNPRTDFSLASPFMSRNRWRMENSDHLGELVRMPQALSERVGVKTEGPSEEANTRQFMGNHPQ